jgi:hypothetical protein
MSGEGPPDRDQIVTFGTHFASYNAGESAAFTAEEAARLAELGVTGDGAAGAPVITAVPAVTQDDAVLNCTMGEWTGEPTGYAYQWKRDGTTDIGDGTTPYTVIPADVGTTVTCIVTATNANGSTAAPASNGVVVTEPATRTASRKR